MLLKKEFRERAHLEEYQDVLNSLIDEILNSNCLLSICDTCITSLIEQSVDNSKQDHIRISLKNIEKPIHVIWSILHEFGHHESGKPNGTERSIEREQEAWERGLKKLQEFPELKSEEGDYRQYWGKKMESYIQYNNFKK